MNVRPLTDESALLRIVPGWRALFARAARPEVVASPAWGLTWWREFGRDGRRLATLAVEDDGGRLVGLAPLASRRVMHRRLVPVRRLELWMTGEPREHEVWSEYVGITAERGREGAVAEALAAALAAGVAGTHDELSLTRVSSDDPVLPALAEALRRRGFEVTTTSTTVCPYARLPATWDGYLKALKKGHRYAVRLSLAELEKWADGRPIELRAATDASSLREGLATLRDLHGARWARQRPGGLFASDRFSRFHDGVLPRLLEDGLLDLLWLRVGDTPVAALYNLVVDGRNQVYQSGRVVEGVPRRLSLGLAMHAHAIQRAIARGDREYDFLGNPTLYKRQLSTDSRALVDLVARSPGVRGRAAAAAVRGADRIADRLRPLVARVTPPPPPAPPDGDDEADDAWPAR